MSTTERTPIVDKNGKPTHVHKKTGDTTTSTARVANVSTPAAGKVPNVELANEFHILAAQFGFDKMQLTRTDAEQRIKAVSDKLSPEAKRVCRALIAELWLGRRPNDIVMYYHLRTEFLDEARVAMGDERMGGTAELVSFEDSVKEQLDIFATQFTDNPNEELRKKQVEKVISNTDGDFTADAQVTAARAVDKAFTGLSYGATIKASEVVSALRAARDEASN